MGEEKMKKIKKRKRKESCLSSIAFFFHHRLGTKKRIQHGIFFLSSSENTLKQIPPKESRHRNVNVFDDRSIHPSKNV